MPKTSISQSDPKIMLQSDAALAGAAELTGEAVYVHGYTHITGYVFTDVDSANPGLIIEQAYSEADLAAEFLTQSFSAIVGGEINRNSLSVQVVAPWARVRYINGAGAQTTFRAFFAARALRGL